MKKRTIYSLLLLVCVIGFWLFENFYTPAPYSDTQQEGLVTAIPEELLPSSTTGSVVEHAYYSFSYHEKYEQAEWVAYMLKKGHLTNDDRKRPYFIEDPKVKSKSADWRNYKGSGFDRGHLCPAGDRRFSKNAYNETFYTSNISPQDNAFNAGIWNRLEQQTRYWAKSYGSVFVVTGGVLKKGLRTIGDEDVAVPEAYYKIIVRGSGEALEVAAFLIPHEESNLPLKDFLVPIDLIEARTGIDFFQELPHTTETILEQKVSSKSWKFKEF